MRHGFFSRACFLVFMVCLGWQTSASAQPVAALQIFAEKASEPVTLNLTDLDALPQHAFDTSTIWTDGVITFSGVPLKTILDKAGVAGRTIEMVALNDYKVTISMADLEDTVPIVATRMDGQQMSVRDKGPFWVVFPYDSDPKYQTETIYSLSIWQLNRLKAVD